MNIWVRGMFVQKLLGQNSEGIIKGTNVVNVYLLDINFRY